MSRRTKIVATIGPASANPETLVRMIEAGMDVARLNFSHGSHEQHAEVAQLVRTDVDSPNESRLRLLIVSGGLAEPKVNEVVRDPKSRRKRKLDLCYPDLKVAIEFDGRHHVERSGQWNNDILRREVLEEMGWRFVIVTSSAMYADPRRVLQRITDKVVVAGGPRMPISDGWKRHFG